MTATRFDQFRRFSTNAYGLERILRFIQACIQILLSSISDSAHLFETAVAILNNRDLRRTLSELSSRLGLVRRFIRFFRFLDAFSSSYEIFTSLNETTAGKQGTLSTAYLEKTLDTLAGTFNGLYLLLEAMTLVDALGITGLTILGPELDLVLKIEAQRCWFVALAFGALGCVLRLSKLQDESRAIRSPPELTPDKKMLEVDRKHEGKLMEDQAKRSKTAAQKWRVSRKMVACLLDTALPGSVIGWVPASKGTVGVVMLTTSVLTGLDVWERCGEEVGRV